MEYADFEKMLEIERKWENSCPEFGHPDAREYNKIVDSYVPFDEEEAESFIESVQEFYFSKFFGDKFDKFKDSMEDYSDMGCNDFFSIEEDDAPISAKDIVGLSLDDLVETMLPASEKIEKGYCESFSHWKNEASSRYKFFVGLSEEYGEIMKAVNDLPDCSFKNEVVKECGELSNRLSDFLKYFKKKLEPFTSDTLKKESGV